MSLQHEYEFDTWFEREYPDRGDRQQKFRMSSVRDLMLAAYVQGRATSGAASGEVVTSEGLARILAESIDHPAPILTESEMSDICTSHGWASGSAPSFRDIARVFWVNGSMAERRAPKPAEQSAPPVPRKLSGLAIAGMAVKHFGNPIPPAAYRFADDLLATQSASTAPDQEVISTRTVQLGNGNGSLTTTLTRAVDAGGLASTAPGQAETERDAESYHARREEFDRYLADSFAQTLGVSFDEWRKRYIVKPAAKENPQ